jgi:hypothetical protein
MSAVRMCCSQLYGTVRIRTYYFKNFFKIYFHIALIPV